MWKRPWLIGVVLAAAIVSWNGLPSFAQAAQPGAAAGAPSVAVSPHFGPRRMSTEGVEPETAILTRQPPSAVEPMGTSIAESAAVAGTPPPSYDPFSPLAEEDPFGPGASESEDDNPFGEKKPDAGKVLRALGRAFQLDVEPYEETDEDDLETDPAPFFEPSRPHEADPFGEFEPSEHNPFGSSSAFYGRGTEKSPKRHVPATTGGKLRSGVKAIEEALDQRTKLEFIETPLHDVVDYLRERHKICIVIDQQALALVGIASDQPITVNIRKLPLRLALDLMLRDFDLIWTIHSDVLLITTPEMAEMMLTTKVYDVADLVVCRDAKGKLWEDYDTLIDVLQTTIEPMSWDVVGGAGSASGGTFDTAKVLVVLQTYRTHRQIAGLLKKLRRVAQKHPGNGKPPRRNRSPGGCLEFSTIPVVG